MLPAKPYPLAVPGNGAFPLQVTGRYFRIQSCTNPVQVIVDGLGNMGTVSAGQGIKLKPHLPPFQRLTFVDTSGAVNNIVVFVADDDFVDNTVLGTVSVIDGAKARTLSGGVFGARIQQPALAGQVSAVMFAIDQGVSSGKRLVLRDIIATTSTGGRAILGWNNANPAGMTFVSTMINKLAGAPQSTTRMLGGNAVPLGAGQVGVLPSGVLMPQAEPLVVPFTYALTVHTEDVNCVLTVGATFLEEPAT